MSDPFAFRRAVNGENIIDELKSFIGWMGFDRSWNFVRYLLGAIAGDSIFRGKGYCKNKRSPPIAIHPMTQILEEPSTNANLNRSIGIGEHIQFILRAGYLKNYPQPLSLRRPLAVAERLLCLRQANAKCNSLSPGESIDLSRPDR